MEIVDFEPWMLNVILMETQVQSVGRERERVVMVCAFGCWSLIVKETF